MSRSPARLLLGLFLALAVTSPARTQDKPGFDHAGLARQVLEAHIRPGYENLLHEAKGLVAAVESVCVAAPGGDTGALEEAFAQTVFAWSRVDHLRFGPVMQDERYARILYWPDHKAIGWRQVKRALDRHDESVLSQPSLQEKSVALQGLGAFEQVLFSGGHEALAKEGPERDFRCGFLAAIAGNIATVVRRVLDAWGGEGGYDAVFLSPGPDNTTYLNALEVTLEIAKSYLVGLEQVRDVRIAGPLGLQRGSKRRRRAAFERSGLSTQAIAASLEGLMHLYARGGLKARIEAHETGMGDAIQNDLDLSLKLLKGIDAPLARAVEDEATEEKLMAIGYPLKNARTQTARVLADAAGLSLGFNALDGD